MDNTINFLSNCRVCDNPDEYANLFYSINRELLCNLISLLGENVTETDGLSQWICRECAEKVEEFIKFRKKYADTSMRLRMAIEESLKVEEAQVEFEIEALDDALFDEQFENLCDAKAEKFSIQIADLPKTVEDGSNDNGPTNDATHSYSCNVCSKSYLHLNSLSRHIKASHELKRHTCPICQSEFTQRSSMAEHMNNLHKTPFAKNVFKCSANLSCQRTFNTAKMLSQHMKNHEKVNDGREIKAEKSSTKKYRKQCQICGLFYKHINEHKLSHQDEKTFLCNHPGCDKTFKFKTSRDVHTRIHKDERNFECSTCQKRFRVSHHLKEHQSVHARDKTFKCDFSSCSKKFSSKLNLYKHSKIHLNKAKS